jgi:hypothetical protein
MVCLASGPPAVRSVTCALTSETTASARRAHPRCSLHFAWREHNAAISLTHFSDGPTGWRSVPDSFSSTFGFRPHNFVLVACATVLWALVDPACSRRWDWLRAAAALAGSVVASVWLGLLDASLRAELPPGTKPPLPSPEPRTTVPS